MKLLILLFISIVSSAYYTKSQNVIISGKIIDKKTEKTLPYAAIQIEKTGIGTVSDRNGFFKLIVPGNYRNRKINISYLGFKTQQKKVSDLANNITICLETASNTIGEVTIMPDSTLKVLLRDAYRKISENYPDEPTKLKGFYRETVKTPQEQYLYFAEAVTETYKTSYNKPGDGQVKILKSVVNKFPGADTLINTVVADGIFSGNNEDIIKQKIEFINPRHFKDYYYALIGSTVFQDNDVYIISFSTINDNLPGYAKGQIYIEKSSLAYIACNFELTQRGIKQSNLLNFTNTKTTSATFSIFYTKYKDKWHLKYLSYQETAFNTKFKSNIILNSEYSTTEISTDSVKPIPYMDRLEPNSIFSNLAANYNSDNYWVEYDVLEKDSLLKNQINTLYTKEQSKELLTKKNQINQPEISLITSISKYFSAVYGIGYMPANVVNGEFEISYIYNDKIIKLTKDFKPISQLTFLITQFNFNYNKKLGIDLSIYKSLSKKVGIKSIDLGISYRFLLLRKSKPLLLKTSLLYSYNNFIRYFPKMDNPFRDFVFDNKTFDAKTIQFGIGKTVLAIKPKIGFQYHIRNLLWLNTAFCYNFNLQTTDNLYLEEKSGFILTRKKAKLALSDNATDLKFNNISTTKSQFDNKNYCIEFGFMLKF